MTTHAHVGRPANRNADNAIGVLYRKCACEEPAWVGDKCDDCQDNTPMLNLARRADTMADFSHTRLGRHTPTERRGGLLITRPGDAYEQEAERVADRVMGGSHAVSITSAPPRIHRAASASHAGMAIPASVGRTLASPGRPLDRKFRQDMERRFGHDFSGVRVHSGALAEQSAREVKAHAYTVGHDIVIGAQRFTSENRDSRRLLAHELTHVVQQSRSGAPVLARACDPVQCPPVEFPLGAFVPSWQLAEDCLQQQYQRSHPNHTVGFNKHWVGLAGKTPHEEATIDCLRPHFTAKGYEPDEVRRRRAQARGRRSIDIPEERQGAAQPQAEPDIFDFTDLTIMEITTPNGLAYRLMKVVWEAEEATNLMPSCSVPAPNQWAPGSWEPQPCYQIVGVGQNLAGKLFFRAWRVGGVLVYMPVLDITREAALAAAAAALGAAAANAAAGGGAGAAGAGATTGARTSFEISKTTFAVLAGIVALGAAVARYFKPAAVALLLGRLLGALLQRLGFGLALAGAAATAGAATQPGGTGGPTTVIPVPVPVPGEGGETSTQERRVDPQRRKKTTTERSVAPPPAAVKRIKIDVIEGLNLDTLSKGMVVPVNLTDMKRRHGVAILQVLTVRKEGGNTTVEFKALQSRMGGGDEPATRQKSGSEFYTVTHPARDLGDDRPKLVGTLVKIGADPSWFANYLENIANDLDAAGRTAEAGEVRAEVERIRRHVKTAKP